MNENIDLTKILKYCPKGTKLYSPLFGEVDFQKICNDDEGAIIITKCALTISFTKEGFYYADEDGECLLFPSKGQRDWSKFKAPWYKKDRFDPKTLRAFDKVLVKLSNDDVWDADFFSHYNPLEKCMKYVCVANLAVFCIPYNDETKHLVGTTEEAPEFYRYWED